MLGSPQMRGGNRLAQIKPPGAREHTGRVLSGGGHGAGFRRALPHHTPPEPTGVDCKAAYVVNLFAPSEPAHTGFTANEQL